MRGGACHYLGGWADQGSCGMIVVGNDNIEVSSLAFSSLVRLVLRDEQRLGLVKETLAAPLVWLPNKCYTHTTSMRISTCDGNF